MAIHEDEASMAQGALPEYLQLARMGVEKGGLGFPVATLLFAVVDAIGSYHRDNAGFGVLVDGSKVSIGEPREHFRILNASYFRDPNGLSLSGEQINRLYVLARSPVTHNAVIGAGCVLVDAESDSPAVEEVDQVIFIRLPALLKLCEEAVKRFVAVSDQIIPQSAPVRELKEKESKYPYQVYRAKEQWQKLGIALGSPAASATAMGRTFTSDPTEP